MKKTVVLSLASITLPGCAETFGGTVVATALIIELLSSWWTIPIALVVIAGLIGIRQVVRRWFRSR